MATTIYDVSPSCEAQYFRGQPVSSISEFGNVLGSFVGLLLGLIGLWTTRLSGPVLAFPFASMIASGLISAIYHWWYTAPLRIFDDLAIVITTIICLIAFCGEMYYYSMGHHTLMLFTGTAINIYSVLVIFIYSLLVIFIYIIITAPGSYAASLTRISSVLTIILVLAWMRVRPLMRPFATHKLVFVTVVTACVSIVLWSIAVFWCKVWVAYAYPGALWKISKAFETYCLLILTAVLWGHNHDRPAEIVWRVFVPTIRWLPRVTEPIEEELAIAPPPYQASYATSPVPGPEQELTETSLPVAAEVGPGPSLAPMLSTPWTQLRGMPLISMRSAIELPALRRLARTTEHVTPSAEHVSPRRASVPSLSLFDRHALVIQSAPNLLIHVNRPIPRWQDSGELITVISPPGV